MPSLLKNIETIENRPYGKPLKAHPKQAHVEPRGEKVDTSLANMTEIPLHGSPFDAQDYMLHAAFYFVMVILAHKVL